MLITGLFASVALRVGNPLVNRSAMTRAAVLPGLAPVRVWWCFLNGRIESTWFGACAAWGFHRAGPERECGAYRRWAQALIRSRLSSAVQQLNARGGRHVMRSSGSRFGLTPAALAPS